MHEVSVWDALLQRYVDDRGRVDYRGWQRRDRSTLRDWLAVQTVHTEGRQDHLAHWINLYNAFTIQAVLATYPIASIRPTVMGVPNWIAFLRFFQRRIYQLDGQRFSLAGIENGMLRRLGDPRIHFAIVCASLGCPLLRRTAYRAEQVERQLEDDLDRFIRDPVKVRFDRARNILFCSRIFQWYRADFLQRSASIPSYILPRLQGAPSPAAAPRVVYLPYDWSLNQRMSS